MEDTFKKRLKYKSCFSEFLYAKRKISLRSVLCFQRSPLFCSALLREECFVSRVADGHLVLQVSAELDKYRRGM